MRAMAEPLAVALDFVVPAHQAGAKYRTPATIDTALAQDLARRLDRPLAPVDAGAAKLAITTLADGGGRPASTTIIPLDYRSAPMAIMRTDSSIRRWAHLRGRTVCLAAGGGHRGELGDRHGAIEIVHASLTEALVALRIGECDAMVHDSPILEELLRFPEWKKFSRRLSARPDSTLALMVPDGDPEMVELATDIADAWRGDAFTDALVELTARDVAFEVYVEQEVPDCH